MGSLPTSRSLNELRRYRGELQSLLSYMRILTNQMSRKVLTAAPNEPNEPNEPELD